MSSSPRIPCGDVRYDHGPRIAATIDDRISSALCVAAALTVLKPINEPDRVVPGNVDNWLTSKARLDAVAVRAATGFG